MFLSAFGMTLKTWIKVPNFPSKIVSKTCSSSKYARDELDMHWDQDGGNALEKLQKGRNCWSICTMSLMIPTRLEESLLYTDTLTQPMGAFDEKIVTRFYTYIHTLLSRCLHHCDQLPTVSYFAWY